MKCPICKHGETINGTASMTLERGGATLIFKNVPAQICNNCGEEFFNENITASILEQAESAVNAGVELDIRQYRAA
ncbi:type II toxin-antitoxin system MqsA family antitoxin [Methylomonas sp. EFPC3]|uniref:type II toxin-antitoxin system MqsA family antitoxin n=1 Tax=Methylomonas sp. EFPC3 TaxID=3021710 RepID=UPI0024167D9D|nr:type II toxin-antitoxin system MqsA family antitoxin [Methylomonas sp. EFPC3]WFP50834.1 type II toxin-antitoxin system MqsA family antitoxin [Methylomonas sp. EFPC3]